MYTAMNANRKISTPPTTGNTTGIRGTMASTASTWWSGAGAGVGADMGIPSGHQMGFAEDFTYTPGLSELGVKTGLPQHRQHLVHMGMATGLDNQLHLGVLRRQRGEGPLVVDLFNIGAGLGHGGGDAGQ